MRFSEICAGGTLPPMPSSVSFPAADAPSPAPASKALPRTQASVDPRAIGTMLLLCLIWSLQQISLKAVAGEASPMLMVALRSLIALLLLAGWMAWRGERLVGTRWRPGLLAGALFALEYLLVTGALTLTHASHVVVFLYTAPIFAALGLQWRLPAERLGRVQWIGTGIAFAGIVIAFLGGFGGTAALQDGRMLLGDLLALLAGAAWGATTVTIRCSTLATASASETLFYQLLVAFVLLLPTAWLTQQWHFSVSTEVLGHLAFQSLVMSFASVLAWCWLLRVYQASQLGVFSFLTPVMGVVLGVVLLGETLTPRFLLGGALVLGGVVLVSGQALLARATAGKRRGAEQPGAAAG